MSNACAECVLHMRVRFVMPVWAVIVSQVQCLVYIFLCACVYLNVCSAQVHGTLHVCRHRSIVGDMCPVYSCVLCVGSICRGTASPQTLPCSDALAPVPGAEVVLWDCASG